MTEDQATYEVKHKKMGRPKKAVKGEKLWVPAECIEFVRAYIELTKQKTKESFPHDNA